MALSLILIHNSTETVRAKKERKKREKKRKEKKEGIKERRK